MNWINHVITLRKTGFILLFLLIISKSFAQIYDPVKWSFSSKMLNDKEAELYFSATIEEKWHLYSQDIAESPPATTFVFEDIEGYELIGKVEEQESEEEYDPNFEMILKYFSDEAVFTQKIRLVGEIVAKSRGVKLLKWLLSPNSSVSI